MNSTQWLDVAGLLNARDVSGAGKGLGLRPGVLLRSACPNEIEEAGVETLTRRLGVTQAIDLRSARERSLVPVTRLLHEPGIDWQYCPLTPEAFDLQAGLPWELQPSMSREERHAGGAYVRFLRDRPDSVLKALRAIGHTPGATLLFCSAGKDRTGVVVALVLAALQVADAAIVADFMASNESAPALLGQQQRTPYGAMYLHRTPESYQVRARTLTGFLRYLNGQFGGALGWLRSVGWTDDDQHGLVDSLVAE